MKVATLKIILLLIIIVENLDAIVKAEATLNEVLKGKFCFVLGT